jgi:hypothetical protein
MKTVRHIAGVLLASVGIMFALGAIFAIADRGPDMPLWAIGIGFVLLGLGPIFGALFLLRPTVFASIQPCPNCGGAKRRDVVALKSLTNIWLLHFGGIILSSLWGASRQSQFKCTDCDTRYASHTRGGRIAGLIFWVIVVMTVLGVVIAILAGAHP